jgi:hypothetical protein
MDDDKRILVFSDAGGIAQLWEAEGARVPEFSESAFHVITGLLLPIWDRLPADNMRVYRFETDRACPRACQGQDPGGERVIGRLVTPEALDCVYEGLGVEPVPAKAGRAPAPGSSPGQALSHQEVWSAVIDRGAVLDLVGDLQVRRSLVMGAHRVELAGFSDGAVGQLKALGLVSEIIAWRLRLFVPTAEERGPAILGAILARHPPLGAHARAAA